MMRKETRAEVVARGGAAAADANRSDTWWEARTGEVMLPPLELVTQLVDLYEEYLLKEDPATATNCFTVLTPGAFVRAIEDIVSGYLCGEYIYTSKHLYLVTI